MNKNIPFEVQLALVRSKNMEAQCIIAYTTAPASYFGFGTTALEACGTYCGKVVLKIAMRPEHAEWQRQRNGSGMHPTWTEEEFTAVQRGHGYMAQWKVDLLAEPEPETRSNYHPDADPSEYGDRD